MSLEFFVLLTHKHTNQEEEIIILWIFEYLCHGLFVFYFCMCFFMCCKYMMAWMRKWYLEGWISHTLNSCCINEIERTFGIWIIDIWLLHARARLQSFSLEIHFREFSASVWIWIHFSKPNCLWNDFLNSAHLIRMERRRSFLFIQC